MFINPLDSIDPSSMFVQDLDNPDFLMTINAKQQQHYRLFK